MISGSISRRYAKALLSIGIETQQVEQLGADLEQLATLLKNDDLAEALQNPSYPLSKRKAILADLFLRLQLSTMIRNFLMLLVDRNRIEFLPGIARDYQAMADDHAGRVRADVVSANLLDPESITRLKRVLEEKTGKHIILEQKTDPDLIAGMVTKIGSIVYDGSIRTKLEQLRQTLLEGEQ